MANKSTHTVRTISRRTIGGDPDSFGRKTSARENKKILFKRMTAVFLLVSALLGALALLENFSKKTVENRNPAPSLKTDNATPLPAVNLDNLESVLNKREGEKTPPTAPNPPVAETSPAENPPTPSEPPPARTPFDDLNYVETPPESANPVEDAPQVEQTVTETGETILKITPKKAQSTVAEKPVLKKEEEKALPVAPSSKIVPETTEPLPMESAPEYIPPKMGRMPSHLYHVQAGIFLESARARALYQKILNAGIPAVMETRVQVGPFPTRKEAENAQKRLKELGVESIVVAPNP